MFRAILNANEHGEPVSVGFPISKSVYADTITKLQQQSMGHAINPDCRVEEVISSVFPVLRRMEGERVNVDELDYLAKRLDSFDVGEAAQFQAMGEKLELHRIKDFINLTFCCQEATVITDFSDLNKVGREHYMNLHGGCAPVAEWDSLNGEEIARSLIGSGSGIVTPYGVVYDNGMKLEQCYQGKQFPAYSYEPELLVLTLHPKGKEFNEESATWLFLPMEEEQLSRTLLRSGITAPGEIQFRFQSSRFPDEIDAALQFETEDIHDLNALCEACRKFNEVDFSKLASVCEMAKPSSAAEIGRLAENIDQFDFIPNVYSPEEYGKYMIQKSGHFSYDENLDDFYNYGDYGAARIREESGMFAYRGYVSYHGTMRLEELMHPDPAEDYRQERGLEMGMGMM